MDSSRCSFCFNAAAVLYAVEGLTGDFYECARCRGLAEPAPAPPLLITDTFASAPTVAPDFAPADEARLLAIVDKLTGARA